MLKNIWIPSSLWALSNWRGKDPIPWSLVAVSFLISTKCEATLERETSF